VIANDLDKNVIAIHKLLSKYASNMNLFVEQITDIARKYNLSCSYLGDNIPEDLRQEYPKTYFAQMNRNGFTQLKKEYNASMDRSSLILYVLMIYGFNRMLRFNRSGEYNIPVGNVDLNNNVINALQGYASKINNRSITYTHMDFEIFMKELKFNSQDFVYLDPPYLLTGSEYTKGWNHISEIKLYKLLDFLDSKKVKFALSNVEIYNDKKNEFLQHWMKGYKVHVVKSNYINYFDNSKKSIKEVLVCNYE
jgi:DNA adenine methylase